MRGDVIDHCSWHSARPTHHAQRVSLQELSARLAPFVPIPSSCARSLIGAPALIPFLRYCHFLSCQIPDKYYCAFIRVYPRWHIEGID